jgi:hypothetical protein
MMTMMMRWSQTNAPGADMKAKFAAVAPYADACDGECNSKKSSLSVGRIYDTQ